MIIRLGHLTTLAIMLLAAGCSIVPEPSISWPPPSRPTTPPPRAPAPMPPVAEPVFIPPPETPEPQYIPPSVPPPLPAPSENAAVMALLQKSQGQSSAGQLDDAGASLERALRIEPRNPVLWQRLARVRLEQKDYPQAENLAAKSNTLAGRDQRLRSENWRIIGEARSRRGDRAGAKAAFERAARE
ncbi:MAG: tetratricopeptide repeat protein [Trichloromonadaceae bacterium]